MTSLNVGNAVQADAERWEADPVGQDKTLGASRRPTPCLHIIFSVPVAPGRGARENLISPVTTGNCAGAKPNGRVIRYG